MITYPIYDKNGAVKVSVIDSLELHDEWMAECFLTISVKSAEPVPFAIGDYIDYRGERYTIQYDPNVLKKAESGSYGEGFTYDNIKFVGLQDEVLRCDFNDIVLNDNNVHYTALPTFPFYCETIDDLLDRIQANLEELYPGQWIVIGLNTVRNSQRGTAVGRAQAFINAYKQYIDPTGAANTEPYGKQGVAETVDNITCWDAMKKVHDDFELNFIVRGRVIIVGTAGVFTSNTFRYGKGNGLYEIERIGESDQQIVTRLRAYGSSENLPQHYYATLNKRVYATITNINGKYGTQGASFIIDLDYDSKYFTYQSASYPTTGNFPNYIVNISANDISVRAYVTKDSSSDKCYVYCEYTGGVDDRDEPDASAMSAFVTALANGDKVYFEDYVKKETFGDGHYEFSSENLPDNMSISRLMLPGFPNQSLHDWVEAHKNQNGYEWLAQAVEDGFTFSNDKYRPYIDSPNIDRYGVRPASIMFDGTDETDDIHPTIEGMKIGNDPVDEIYAVDQVEDNGVYPAGEDVKNINIILPALGFDLSKVFEDGATIDMKNGMCGARSFKIEETPTKDSNNHWICNVSRVHDESLDLWFPYEDFQIHGSSEAGRTSGDKYVLTGITMPDAYIDSAAVRLLQAAIEALKKNHAPRYTYQPRIDEIWMQRQHDSSIKNNDVVSLHDTLKAGDIFAFADDDLNIDANIIIDILTIRENGNNGIPTYEITLRDDKEVGTIQKISNKIDSVFSSAINGAGGGSGLTPQQIQSIVRKEGNDRYLSKVEDDTAKGNISFEKNINVGGRETVNEIQSTEYTGDGMLDTGYRLWYEEGRAKLVIDDLVARGKFTANELETRIWTYAGGNMVFSGAGSTLFFVEYLDANDNALGYTYINQPWLLRGRALLAGGLAWSKRKAIQRELTEAEKAQVVKFRCYEYSDDGTMQTRNWWKPNDIAMCETLNKVRSKANSDGSYSGSASNTVYKRRIAGIGSKEIPMLNDGRIYDYVDLWNIYDLAGNSCKYKGTDGQEHLITDSVKGYDSSYHDWPAAGDVIVQMGNPLDTDRQAAVTIEVQGDVHGFKVYDTISDYSMENKLWVEIGYDQTTSKAKANVYGDFRFGCRESEEAQGGSYVKYDRNTKVLDIKAKINAQSTMPYNGSDTTLANIFSGLNQQIDGKVETWRQATDPASAWTTDDERLKHVGDLWMDISANGGKKTYIYQDNGTSANPRFVWDQQDVPQAVFDGIDGKASVYATWGAWVIDNVNKLHLRDLLIPSSDIDRGGGVVYKAGKVYRCTQVTPSIVFTEVAYTDDTTFHNYVGLLLNKTWASGDDATAAAAQRAVLRAVKGDTVVDGGLLLTSLIAMRQFNGSTGQESDPTKYTTWGGISGIYDDWSGSTHAKGHGIAAWFGGAMVDKEDVQTLPASYAKSLFRMDGSGYVADGGLSWDYNGQGKTVVTLNGDVVKAANYYLNGTDITQQLQNLFDMFEKDTTTIPGTTLIKAKYTLYSVGDIQAFSSSSGSGGGGASVLYELNDVWPDSTTTPTKVKDAQPGYVLTYGDDNHWYAAPAAQTYVLPRASDTALGGVKTGFTTDTTNKNYAVVLDNDGKAYVNVPWSGGTQSDWNETNTSSLAYIKNKPTIPTVPTNVSAFNNDSGYITSDDSCDYATSAGSTNKLTALETITYGANYLQFKDFFAQTSGNSPTEISNPTGDWYHHIVMNHGNSAGYFVDMAICFHDDYFYYRRIAGGNANSWVRVIDSSNIGSQSVSYATTSGTATYANSAGSASSAGYATSAGSADSAGWAGGAGYISDGSMDVVAQYNNEVNFGGSDGSAIIYFGYRARGSKGIPTSFIFGGGSGSASITCNYLYANSDVQVTSDERRKDVIGNVELSVEQIAKMPSVLFRWKKGFGDDLIHVGTIAQSWEKVLPAAVGIGTDELKTRSFSYSSAAFAMAHADACEIVALKKRVSKLEAELKRYKSA